MTNRVCLCKVLFRLISTYSSNSIAIGYFHELVLAKFTAYYYCGGDGSFSIYVIPICIGRVWEDSRQEIHVRVTVDNT